MAAAPDFWRRRGPAAIALLPLAGLFGLLAGVRRWLYRRVWRKSIRVGVPVVVVGNLTAGGSGKTPLIVALADALRERGFRPGVVSRGYGGRAVAAACVTADSTAASVGDEPLLIRHKTGVPVAVGRDRVAAARLLLATDPGIDVLLADDGLQHYRLARTLEICVIDAASGLGNGWLLPAGPLREPVSRLGRVDAVLLSGEGSFACAQPHWRVTRTLGQVWRLRAPEQQFELAGLPRKRWIAACGIARPQGFFAALERVGIDFEARAFADHHAFAPGDLPVDAAVLMTEKDAVKCGQFAADDWWAVALSATPDPGFFDWLEQRLRA